MARRDLPRPTVPPWMPATEISDAEPRCKNCWCFERPVAALTSQGTDKGGFTAEDTAELDAYLADAGFCTLHPPNTGANRTAVQPITHASYRCSSFTHKAMMEARVAAMAKGEDPDAT